MNGLGRRIKYHRIKLNMTQTELSKGIISVSYLSKIENGSTNPPPEVIGLICRRLKIEPYSETDNDKKYTDLCLSWFKYLFYNDRDNMIRVYQDIEEKLPLIVDSNLITLIEIHKLRYYILINEPDKAEKQYYQLSAIAKRFNSREKYYWIKFSGYYHIANLSYGKSLKAFIEAKQYVSSVFYLEEEEKYGLYYMIALSASYARKLYVTLNYANKALEYYQKNYLLKQCAQCHILIGITCTRLKDYEEAIKSYKLAETIAENIGDEKILATTFQNTGYLYTILKNQTEAIRYYLKSFNIRTSARKKIVPISSLMKLYYQNEDHSNAYKWFNEGSNLLNNNNLDLMYINEFKVYEQLLKGVNSSTFEDLILKDIIPFLDEKELYYDMYSYLEILADYYYKNRRYKFSSDYYKKALRIKSNL